MGVVYCFCDSRFGVFDDGVLVFGVSVDGQGFGCALLLFW